MSRKGKDNAALVGALKKGEKEAYNTLVDMYHKILHAYAISLVHDFAMAQDIVQNVFLNLWNFRTKLDENYSIKGFLYKSVYNEFVNTYQKRQSMMLIQRRYLESISEVVEETDLNEIQKMTQMVKQEASKLPNQCQKIFELSKKDGLTNNEIAEYLGISVKTVENHMTHAYATLRKRLHAKFKTIILTLFNLVTERSSKLNLSIKRG
ncbi:MAG: RNA polymerase sigma-70 factor [Flavobacteriaceae bacterium]